jgi:hypothetical protein
MSIQVDLFGPYTLDETTVNRVVPNRIGVYALGSQTPQSELTVRYVGRSDNDVCVRLTQWARSGKYGHFMVKTVTTTKDAYDGECRLYHMFSGLDNNVHPAKPAGTNYTCPTCGH